MYYLNLLCALVFNCIYLLTNTYKYTNNYKYTYEFKFSNIYKKGLVFNHGLTVMLIAIGTLKKSTINTGFELADRNSQFAKHFGSLQMSFCIFSKNCELLKSHTS